MTVPQAGKRGLGRATAARIHSELSRPQPFRGGNMVGGLRPASEHDTFLGRPDFRASSPRRTMFGWKHLH